MSAFDAGFRAGFDGKTADSNPYPSDTPSFEEWDEGHAAATSKELVDDYDDYGYDDCPLDGDAESTFDSVEWGVDEDYSHYDEW